MQDMTEKKKKGVTALLRLAAAAAALVMFAGFSIPLLRKSSALGAVGERALCELTPFSTAVAYYSGGEIARLAQKPSAADSQYRYIAELLSQVNTQQGYEGLYLVYRDAGKSPRYLADGKEYPLALYKPAKAMLDKIYTGKSVGAYAGDLVLREDQRQVQLVCQPIYGSGRTVLAVLFAECDPGNTGYHMVGPANLYYIGGGAAAVLLLCVLALLGMRKYRLAKTERQRGAEEKSGGGGGETVEPIPPEDDFQLPMEAPEAEASAADAPPPPAQ